MSSYDEFLSTIPVKQFGGDEGLSFPSQYKRQLIKRIKKGRT
jgi:hypothetical protein